KVQLITLGPVYVLESNKHLKQNAEELGGIIYQAEAMKLDGYQVGESAAAAGGQCVATTGNGIAAQLFTGEEGVYTIVVYYFDESDGQSSYALRVDGEMQDSWVANDLRGSTRIDAANRARREIRGVTLSTGSLIEIASTANGSEYGSLDQIVIIRR
ncbi:MAG: hypothetical protein NWS71_07270, partial [Opitutales bacterium]|nr:hypothetical protein [Opitutales bacterium]